MPNDGEPPAMRYGVSKFPSAVDVGNPLQCDTVSVPSRHGELPATTQTRYGETDCLAVIYMELGNLSCTLRVSR